MRDLPIFHTQLGVASLTLSQIPYTKTAYIRLQDTASPEAFLQECCDFCRAVDAQRIYATGHSVCQSYPEHTAVLQLQADCRGVGDTEASLFPVTEQTLEQWRTIYNEKVVGVPNGAWMTITKAKEVLEQGSGYFVHSAGKLLGIGMVRGNQLLWVASVCPGAGADVVRALCHAITADTVVLEVASANQKAMALYEKLGFVATKELSRWYQII